MIRRKVDDSLHFQSYLQVAAHRLEGENKHTGKKLGGGETEQEIIVKDSVKE